jgi:hypothetical protein
MGTKCKKSLDGKHDWTYNIKVDAKGNEKQYRRCDPCHIKQRHIITSKTLRSRGWKTIEA